MLCLFLWLLVMVIVLFGMVELVNYVISVSLLVSVVMCGLIVLVIVVLIGIVLLC